MGEYEDKDWEFELKRILDKVAGLGASYADARFQRQDNELIWAENKFLKSYSSSTLSGIGIRATVGGAVGYASTSDLTRNNLDATLQNAIKAAKSIKTEKNAHFAQTKPVEASMKSPAKIDPFAASPEEKVSVALQADKAAWINDQIRSTMTILGLAKDFRLFMSTEGAKVSVETAITGLAHASVAQVNGVMESVFDIGESQCAGFEFIKSTDWNSYTGDLSKLVIESANSKTSPAGTYPVVVDPQVFGGILHEAFGHSSEGDFIASGQSVLQHKLDSQIASEHVTVVDEGTAEGGFYCPFDDEGVKKEKTVIVENGVLKNYLLDRQSALQLGRETTGNGRAQDFENLPIVRQTNCYLQPRDYSFEELIEDIDFGIYVMGKGLKGGEVSVGMGTFTFGVGPSKIIRKGELAETVKGVAISGSILDTLKTIDAIGNQLEVRTNVLGKCGKSSQRVWVGDGGPQVRVRTMTVGGA